tara:strand:+ start:1057 stop:3030 length:1974 start_codon:yes stop_codon:yes gene_type:complete
MATIRNPKNRSSLLFKRLTRLFSGPLVNYRSQTERQLRRRFLDKHKFQSASGKQFKKTAYNPLEQLQSNLMVNQERTLRYNDFQQMEFTPELASALDIYADEMTTSSGLQPLLTIDCPNQEIKSILEALYSNILNVEFNLFGWCRTMCKFGDFFLYLDIDEDLGVKHVIGLPAGEIERLEGQDSTNPNYVQYQWNSGGLTFENWQVAHFRILGNDKFAPYGTSVLDPARRIWRQLNLLEDAMMAYRIVRSPERRVFYIDVGNISAPDVEQYMQKVMTQMKRNQVVDPDTGRVDLRYNPMSIEEDYFIPVRGGQSSRIETVPGGTYTGDIDDVKYLRDKLFAAIKVPQSYLSRGEGADEDKQTLAQKDIRFARTIQRLQRSIVAELEKVGTIHLYILGFKGKDLVDFKLALNNPSKISEMQELEHWRTKFDVAASATEGYFSKRWVAKHIFNLSEEVFIRIQRELFHDAKFESILNSTSEAAGEAALAAQGVGGDILGGEEEGFEPDELGAEEEAEDLLAGDEGGEIEIEDDDSPAGGLLATPGGDVPGKRDDEWYKIPKRRKGYLTKGAKGKWYRPVATDKRDMGARKRSMWGKYSSETAKSTDRNIFKGFSLAKGIYEVKETSYDSEEEHLLFESKKEIADLIAQMESKKNETEAQ